MEGEIRSKGKIRKDWSGKEVQNKNKEKKRGRQVGKKNIKEK